MKIDVATKADVPAILDLWIELMDFHAALNPVFTRSADAREKYEVFLWNLLDSGEALCLVAREEPSSGAPAGYALARINREPPVFERMPRGLLLDFYVRPGARRRGLGGAMLGRMKEWFAGRGIARIEVMMYPGNPIASAFWRKQGFADYLHGLFLEVG